MLELTSISKSFPGVKSLDSVNFSVKAGQIHALVGENGAGKSTLTKIIAGVYQADEGTMRFEGQEVRWSSPRVAKAKGIHVIYQEFVLFPELSVAENIFIGTQHRSGFVSYKGMFQAAEKLLSDLGVEINPRAFAKDLTVANQQMVEIAKALVGEIKLLILDEPTAVIAGHEVEQLFERIRGLSKRGVGIVYISHRLEEIFRLCEQVTILKDGKVVDSLSVATTKRNTLVSKMVGRELGQLFPLKATDFGPEAVRLEHVSDGERVKQASLSVRQGEIVGLAGMVGAGRTELALTLFGAHRLKAGKLTVKGQTLGRMTPEKAISLGLGLVTEDRKGQGLMMLQDVAVNTTASSLNNFTRQGFFERRKELAFTSQQIKEYQIICRSAQTGVKTLSGGNQQKILLSRWASTTSTLLILDEPTRGVDVGAKAEIYRLMRKLAAEGLAILMISSELSEIIGMSDRVVVMREGVTVGELSGQEINEEAVMNLATAGG